MQVNDFRQSTIDLYYAALRHRPLARYPRQKYTNVLTATGIPKDVYKQPSVDSLSLSLRNEAYAFLIAHELAHVLFGHKGYAEITKAQARADEVKSDRFALDVTARITTSPLGAVFHFPAQIYRFRHRGEFNSAEAWYNYSLTVATHPMAVDRH